MAMEYSHSNEHTQTENVIFIGLLCEQGLWKAIVFEIDLAVQMKFNCCYSRYRILF